MITLYLCTKDPYVFERLALLKNAYIERCHDLKLLVQKGPAGIALIHLQDKDEQPLINIKYLIDNGVKVIALSNMPSAVEGTQLFKWGVKGYLNTFSDLATLEQAIQVIHQNHVWLGQTVMSAIIQNITQQNTAANYDWQIDLSERQLATAQAILKGQSNKEIAEQLNVSERTIKSYVQQLLEKFDAKDRLGLVLKIHNWPSV